VVVIHSSPHIGWHRDFAPKMANGLRNLGVHYEIASARHRIRDGLAILLGTSSFRDCEKGGDYLLVDRCSFGDTNQWVTLVRNGHGRRGEHRVPDGAPADRWERYGVPVKPWQTGSRRVLCGQTESWSPHHLNLTNWYRQVKATHFRKHPRGDNPTKLPEARDWTDCGMAITLNSSVGVDAVLAGVPTVTMDQGAMAWDVAGHTPNEIRTPDREPWLHWLAWTQWTHDEINEGTPWAHLL
jgi:hypothetical protein